MEPRSETPSHIPELDGLRGIAVLSVMVMHFYDPVAHLRPLGALSRVIEQGAGGVDLFFVLSGFLITGILTGSRGAMNYFRVFYARRALRILPLYICVVGLFFVSLPLLHRFGFDMETRPSQQIWFWTFLANWPQALGDHRGAQLAHLWSVAIEEQFYFLWSLVVWVTAPRHMRGVIVSLIAVCLALRAAAQVAGMGNDLSYFSTFTHMDGLLLGSLLALEPGFRRWVGRWGVLILLVCVPVCLWSPNLAVSLTAWSLMSTAAIALGLTRPAAFLRWSWLRQAGKYSYAMYLLHYLVHGALPPLSRRMHPLPFALLSIFGGIAISYLLARLSWRWIEEPWLRRKGRYRYQFVESATAEPAMHL